MSESNSRAQDYQGGAVLAPATLPREVVVYPGPAVASASGAVDFQPTDILHGLRRWGWVCALIGIPLAGLAATGAWVSQTPTYQASSLLRLSSTRNSLVFNKEEGKGDFDLFKGTQKELVRSSFVMTAALRNPAVAELSIIRQQAEPIDWLVNNVQVNTPSNTEIMQISVELPEPKDAINLVNAVVQAYQSEVVNFEQNSRQHRLDEVGRIFTEKESELRRKRNELKQLTAQLGSSDTDALSFKQQFMVQELGDLRRQLVDVQSKLWNAEAELETAETIAAAAQEGTITDEVLEAALLSDSVYRSLMGDKLQVSRIQAEAKTAFKIDRSADYANLTAHVDTQVADRRIQLTEELQQTQPIKSRQVIRGLQANIGTLTQLEHRVSGEIARLKNELGQVGNQSIDVEMMRSEINQLGQILSSIAQEREELQVELRSRPRVEILQVAESTRPANFTKRLGVAGLAGAFALAFPVGVILLGDLGTRKINSSQDVIRSAGLEILGSIPVVPRRAIGQLKQKGNRNSVYWQQMLNESVRRIASRILSGRDGAKPRMMLVTSAVSGEGKTTLATQLALSLASSGRSVLLVDLDLRRPTLHRVYAVDGEPGMSELLRGEAELSSTIQATGMENLSVLTAGKSDEEALRFLSHESTGALLKELRSQADFVIIDGCPVLLLADIGYICPHVDGVLFAVRRDVSRVPEVRAARESIDNCGTPIVGAVVVESGGAGRRDRQYVKT